jgi:uncharacterized coiled-coil DUF342 family protein
MIAEEKEAREREIDELRSSVRSLEKLPEVERRVEELSSALVDAGKMKEDIDRTSREVEGMRKEIGKVQETVDKEKEAREREIDELRSSIRSLERLPEVERKVDEISSLVRVLSKLPEIERRVDELSSRIPDAEEISSVVKEIESLRSFAESERREINERISQLSSSLLEIKRMRKELDELSEELTGLMKVIGTGEETIKKLETDLRSQILKLSSRIDFLSREESLEELLRERELILERMRRAK